jgi:hypothetical protein
MVTSLLSLDLLVIMLENIHFVSTTRPARRPKKLHISIIIMMNFLEHIVN